MSKQAGEVHTNGSEIFPLWEPLGSSGDGAAIKKLLGNLAAALAAAALALSAFLYFYADSTPLYIGITDARVEIRLYNMKEDQKVYWTLVNGPPPGDSSELTDEERSGLERLTEQTTVLDLQNLEPNTQYTVVVVELDEGGQLQIVHTFTFWTDEGGKPVEPPAGDPPEGGGNVTPPPGQNPPAGQDPPAEDPPPQEDPPELPPPPAGGGNTGGGSSAKNPGRIDADEVNEKNRIDSEQSAADGWLSVTVTVGSFIPGDYEFRVTNVEIDCDGVLLTEEAGDYRNMKITVGSNIVLTFDLKIQDAWKDKNYAILGVLVEGGNYENGTMVGELSGAYVMGQVNLVPGYTVEQLTSALSMAPLNGMYCSEVNLETEGGQGTSLQNVVPGQTVTVVLYFEGSATAPFTLGTEYETQLAGFQAVRGTDEITEVGDSFAWLTYSFPMPDRTVTNGDITFKRMVDMGAGNTGTTQQPEPGVPNPGLPGTGLSGGSWNVGPLTIDQEIHGLRCVQVRFHTDSLANSQSLTGVPAGTKVYAEIFLQGAARKDFNLSAAFHPSPKLANFTVENQDSVSITDEDAYLRISFTMPGSHVTGADIGFGSFIAG